MGAPGSRSIFVEVLRETFPVKLRFDKPCQILYAQCSSVAKQNKHKRFIPRRELEAVLSQHVSMPGRPWLQLPVIRQILCIRIINACRGVAGYPSWLYTRSVEEEYGKIQSWLDRQTEPVTAKRRAAYATAPSSPSSAVYATGGGRPMDMVERELFEREVLGSFRVANLYQRMVRSGAAVTLLLLLLLLASVNTDYVVYLCCAFWWRMERSAVLAWMREVTQRHTVAEIPEAYKSILPSPCFSYRNKDGAMCYGVNIVELVSAEKGVTVVCIPCPHVGEKSFFEQVGQVAIFCDAVVMEGARFEDVDRITPAALLPLKGNTFPALGVHHRFLDILRTAGVEPPTLYPGSANVSWKVWLQQVLLPFELRCVYKPTELSATKGEARVGWGRLRDQIDARVTEVGPERGKESPHYVIAVPWTAKQIASIEASLVRYGFKVKSVFPLHWIEQDHLGRSFCDYYGIA